MNVFVPKDDRLRHKILKEYNEATKMSQFSGHGTKGCVIQVVALAKLTGTTKERIVDVSKLLIAEGDLLPHFTAGTNEQGLLSTEKTVSSYLHEKYLNYRWEKMRENIDFFIRLTAIFSLVLSVVATVNTCNDAKEKNKAIEDLQIRVRGLESKPNPAVQQKK